MDQSLVFLFAAFFVAWLVLILYLANLSGRLAGLRRELESLKRQEEADRKVSPRGSAVSRRLEHDETT